MYVFLRHESISSHFRSSSRHPILHKSRTISMNLSKATAKGLGLAVVLTWTIRVRIPLSCGYSLVAIVWRLANMRVRVFLGPGLGECVEECVWIDVGELSLAYRFN